MKELSIEQKAKAYDLALERAKSLIGDTIIEESGQHIAEVIFPELKESEDKRIRKTLIENFKWFCGDFPETTKWGKDDNLLVKDIIAWLEKQGETYTKRDVDNAYIEGMAFAKNELEKQGEQKVNYTTLVETGNGGINALVTREVSNNDYEKKPADKVEPKKIELQPYQWNISDFRTWQYIVSDVLTKHNGIGQYLDNGLCRKIAQYMQEEWSKKLCSIQHTAWSEEDECYMTECINAIATKDGWSFEEKRKTKHWLKSLKPQKQWKPSDDQMKALSAINVTGGISYAGQEQELINLYNELKKL